MRATYFLTILLGTAFLSIPSESNAFFSKKKSTDTTEEVAQEPTPKKPGVLSRLKSKVTPAKTPTNVAPIKTPPMNATPVKAPSKNDSQYTKYVGTPLPDSKLKPKFVPADRPIVIVSIDGGGVRGVIPTVMIEAIEKELKMPISSIGNVFAGTSAGSIIAALLNIPGKNGKPQYSGAQAIEISNQVISEIFTNSAFRSVRTIGGLAGAKYSAKPLETHLQKLLGTTTLGTTINPVVIPTVNMRTKAPYVFSTYNALENPKMNNLPLWLAVRASTAAPTYFKSVGIELADGEQMALADGGLTANNPELLGLLKATLLYPNHKKFIVVSLSTGKPAIKDNIKTKGNRAGSLFRMLKPTIDTALDAQATLSQETMKMITKGNSMDVEYHRINVEVPKACAALDNASAKNLKCLTDVATRRIQQDDFKVMIEDLKDAVIAHNSKIGSHHPSPAIASAKKHSNVGEQPSRSKAVQTTPSRRSSVAY